CLVLLIYFSPEGGTSFLADTGTIGLNSGWHGSSLFSLESRIYETFQTGERFPSPTVKQCFT
ncbi:MAG: hypothetical protein U1C33_04285, partial [Candidatus Cloacimonadaceae bacterium]|nr:hypothetical protein [Candidatus Cloacimonadaceae bacterium]